MTQITKYIDTPTRQLAAAGTTFAYRTVGQPGGVPVIYLNHLASNLYNADPRVVDGLAARHHLTLLDYRGVGQSGGTQPDSLAAMATDVVAFIKALGYAQVDIVAFSMGGFIAQEVLEQAPQLVRKLVLAGTGPRGGQGVSNVVGLTYWDMLRGLLTLRDPKFYLFFTQTARGKAAAWQYLARLKERTVNRDEPVGLGVLQKQLKAIVDWGHQPPADLSRFTLPVLIVNGDHDRMVPTPNSYDMARRFPNAELVIYEDAGHGGVF
ncbi:alpha/beta hydrolase [Hymenobacter sp. M29]|uniref:Alpha/beta hydrolase n=1 Tax=Hymenobacter mellowenesis TaxID=3063995 RepID=A0ABT9A8H3_9BACT|nr:alpha/beta hydrolase [Hymenobacter sp. M29]MDO7846146.1 alpha/beta hydrolase [Hymenobacter sp. M29]